MVNVNGSNNCGGVSNEVMQQFNKIANLDGKEGISSGEEKKALADLLSSGKITGKLDQEYIQGEINKFDLDEAKKNVSDFVKKAISNAMKMTGDKNSIDDNTELAVLDSIIDNTSGEYSVEDIQYAKLIKEQSSYTGKRSDVTTLKEENGVLQEKVTELIKENKELKTELNSIKQETTNASKELDNVCKDLNNIPEAAKSTINVMKGDLGTIGDLCSETMALADGLLDKQNLAQEGKLSKSTFDKYETQVKAKINANILKITQKKAELQKKAKQAGSSHPKIGKRISKIPILSKIGVADEAANTQKTGIFIDTGVTGDERNRAANNN